MIWAMFFFNNVDFDCFLVKFWKYNSISENSTLQLACWLFVLSISFILICFLFGRFSCLPLVHLLLRLSARLLWLALFRRSFWRVRFCCWACTSVSFLYHLFTTFPSSSICSLCSRCCLTRLFFFKFLLVILISQKGFDENWRLQEEV